MHIMKQLETRERRRDAGRVGNTNLCRTLDVGKRQGEVGVKIESFIIVTLNYGRI